jgi:hypothetical protein
VRRSRGRLRQRTSASEMFAGPSSAGAAHFGADGFEEFVTRPDPRTTERDSNREAFARLRRVRNRSDPRTTERDSESANSTPPTTCVNSAKRVLLRRGSLSGSLQSGSGSTAPPVATKRREGCPPGVCRFPVLFCENSPPLAAPLALSASPPESRPTACGSRALPPPRWPVRPRTSPTRALSATHEFTQTTRPHSALVTCRSGTPKVRRKYAGSSPQKDPPGELHHAGAVRTPARRDGVRS